LVLLYHPIFFFPNMTLIYFPLTKALIFPWESSLLFLEVRDVWSHTFSLISFPDSER
jgi:hypothetical protein